MASVQARTEAAILHYIEQGNAQQQIQHLDSGVGPWVSPIPYLYSVYVYCLHR